MMGFATDGEELCSGRDGRKPAFWYNNGQERSEADVGAVRVGTPLDSSQLGKRCGRR